MEGSGIYSAAFCESASLRVRQRLPPRGSWQNRQVLTEGVRPRPKTPPVCKKCYNFFLKKAGFPLTALL